MWPMAPPLPPRFPVKTEFRTLTYPVTAWIAPPPTSSPEAAATFSTKCTPSTFRVVRWSWYTRRTAPPKSAPRALRRVRFRRVIVNDANW